MNRRSHLELLIISFHNSLIFVVKSLHHYGYPSLSAFPADATSQLDILWHDRDTLGMNGAQVGVFEQSHQVGFSGLLEGKDSGGLEAEVGLEVLSDFTDEALERSLADQEIGALLVLADLTKSHSSRAVTVGLLDASGGWGALAGGLWKRNGKEGQRCERNFR